jgi:two-component system cell cycle sensor histidine kinase/response regulator CckA
VVRSVEHMLDSLGYKVVSKTDGISALETFREQPEKYDLVITDMTMPNMTGDCLAEKIKQLRADVPIILCTGFSEKISRSKAQDLGINEFLMKPIDTKKFAETISRVLRNPKKI